jgi:hypothetical protein
MEASVEYYNFTKLEKFAQDLISEGLARQRQQEIKQKISEMLEESK